MSLNYKHVLVTGGAGFIGSHLVDYLVNQGYKVRILDNLHSQIHPNRKPPKYLNQHAEFIKGDVTDAIAWRYALKGIDAVFHFAAAVGVGQSMYEIERYVKDNCLGTALLLDFLVNHKHSVKKILVAASMSSYGEGMYKCPKCGLSEQPELRKYTDLKKQRWEPYCANCQSQLVAIPTAETTKLNSPSIYAVTKKSQEEMIMSIGKAYRIPVVSLRFFNVYGTRQSLSNPYTGVVAIFISRVKNKQPPIINEDGIQSRDFIHIHDIVRACGTALKSERANYEIFNVGSGIPITIREIAEIIIKLGEVNLIPLITNKFRSVDVRHCFADRTKIKNLIGWEPNIFFPEGIKDIWNWSKNQTATDHLEYTLEELTKYGLRQ